VDRSPGPLLLTVVDVAETLATSVKTVRRMDLAGRLPPPVRVGRGLRWRRAELHDWVVAGCPARDEWTWNTSCNGGRATNGR